MSLKDDIQRVRKKYKESKLLWPVSAGYTKHNGATEILNKCRELANLIDEIKRR